MLFNFLRYFGGYLRVRLYGYAPERFLNLCGNHNILIWNLQYQEDGYVFYISLKAFWELRPLLKKTETHLVILERRGLPFFLQHYRRRKMFFIGILVCLGLLMLANTRIWCIDIAGNSSYSTESILKYLTENGCYNGINKKNLDCAGLEEQMRIDYPDIIWVSAQIDGTRLSIHLQENLVTGTTDEKAALVKSLQEKKGEQEGFDLVAEKDGLVQSIVTRNGTPLVKQGDTVHAGDILVSGRLDLYNDSGEVYQSSYVVADADILVESQYEYDDSFPMNDTGKEYTGAKSTSYLLKLGPFLLDGSLFQKKYKESETLTSQFQLHILKNFYLPVWIQKKEVLEYESVEETYTESEAKNLAASNLKTFLNILTEKNVEILEKNVIIDIVGHSCTAQGTIQTLEYIGIYRNTDIVLEDTDEIETDER